ncbi:MAG: hypothetical protein IPM21_16455 [Acidobacteria bacterium]|nr:hypothetical protein [Acidobacteriota bacterium]
MKIEQILDGIHGSVIKRRWAQLFTAFVRVLLGFAFIPPSIPKILSQPFTVLPDSNPVGAYFNALYHTGFYYNFLGWSQLIAAILLLIPRTSHLGALMFFPIIVNIAILTSSVGFVGTWLITGLMALAALHLVGWEYDRWKGIIFRDREWRTNADWKRMAGIVIFFAAGGVPMGILWYWIGLGNFPNYLRITGILVGLGFVFGVLVAFHYRLMPVGRLNDPELK